MTRPFHFQVAPRSTENHLANGHSCASFTTAQRQKPLERPPGGRMEKQHEVYTHTRVSFCPSYHAGGPGKHYVGERSQSQKDK